MLDLLKSDTYVEPGTYIKRSVDKDKLETINRIQFPVVLGVGSRFFESQEVITRGYIYDESVSVSELYPNTFSTKFAFIPDVKKIKIYENDNQLPTTSWSIVDSHTIQLKEFNPDASYSISYPSNDRSVKDKLSLDVVNFDTVGDVIGSGNYEYGVNYYLDYFFDNLRVNKESKEDALQFYPLYFNYYDYPVIKSFDSDSYLEIDVSNVEENIDIKGFVLRVDRGNITSENEINFIWLEFNYVINNQTSKQCNLKVINDGNYHYWKGIGFKITSDDIVGKELTKKGEFIEESENPNQFSLSVCAPKKLIKGPNRTVSAKIINKGEIVKTGTISNIVTECAENFYYIGATNATSKSSKFHLRIDDYFIKDRGLLLTFVYSDEFDNKQYKEVECTLYNNTIELHNYSVEFEINGVHTTIYGSDILALTTEDDVGLMTEDDMFLLIDSSTSIVTYYRKNLISFDYIRGTTDNPTIVEVSNTFSRETERVSIDSDDFYYFNNVSARLNYNFNEGDVIEFNVEQTGYICWDLTQIVEENEPCVRNDVTGEITGEYCSRYVQLKYEYLCELKIISDEEFEYEVITKDSISYIVFTKDGLPYSPRTLKIKYRSYTKEPKANENYYIVANCIRPDSMYNTLIEVTSLDEGRKLLGPFDKDNDLFKANEIAWREFSTPLSYGYVQIKDSDNDGIISAEDVEKAFEALYRNKRGTDIVLLNKRQYQKFLIDFNNSANNPFERNENKIWIDSIDVDYAKELSDSEYAEFKNVVATGRALLNIEWENQNANMIVDNSFVTWAIVCIRNSIDYSETILNRVIKSFSEIELLDERYNKEFAENNMIYITKKEGDYVITEDFCLTGLEQVSNQKVITTRYIRKQMDANIGKVIELPTTAITQIQSSLVTVLNELINKGYISSYLDEEGNKRPLDANKDIFVTNVKNNPTIYQFGYGFYTKKGIKHLFGSYVVDRNFK